MISSATPTTSPATIGIKVSADRVRNMQIPERPNPMPMVNTPTPASVQYAGLFSSLTLSQWWLMIKLFEKSQCFRILINGQQDLISTDLKHWWKHFGLDFYGFLQCFKALFIYRITLNNILLQHLIRPAPEFDAMFGFYTVADGNNHVKAIKLYVSFNISTAFILNCRKFCDSWIIHFFS